MACNALCLYICNSEEWVGEFFSLFSNLSISKSNSCLCCFNSSKSFNVKSGIWRISSNVFSLFLLSINSYLLKFSKASLLLFLWALAFSNNLSALTLLSKFFLLSNNFCWATINLSSASLISYCCLANFFSKFESCSCSFLNLEVISNNSWKSGLFAYSFLCLAILLDNWSLSFWFFLMSSWISSILGAFCFFSSNILYAVKNSAWYSFNWLNNSKISSSPKYSWLILICAVNLFT